ncbi:transglycosylase domain-containing protein [Vagococcus intermedius]|uniref:PBP1A family penicillin-binding protein n=1 Tax=Vagococcus intermedius TaxID=2991418 RepID=A0AAF0CVQ5_9ENTE|nr:PBP1A family penicillin-binding protein [Vagococcus intermedius]WEG73716.1 PBP1A family penicillin-binding protein [Vagococcus intermedius]WEG75801.1 PBP1A family penicillin-binding protein [Vagococcus intermedius]
MDEKKLTERIKASLHKFWMWLKPYLIQFHHWRKRVWKKYQINKIIVLVTLTVMLVTSIYLFYLAKSANVETLKAGLSQVTTVYDQEDQEAGTLYGQKGTFVELDKISPNLVDALVSTEDRRFYEHKGFDVRGIARAVVGVLTRGHITGGGSTITQQLAKNAYLTLDQTLNRKAKELFLAIEIEKKYSKDEIMEMYLNNAYFANGVWGVEDASHKYFGKNAANLTVDEAAVIIGMLKGPTIFNPIDNFEAAKDRRNTVLEVMAENGKIEQASSEQMQKDELYLSDDYEDKKGYQYLDYFDAVINEAESRYKIKDEDLLNKGYKIYTALDQQYQQDMDTTFKNDDLFPEDAEDGEKVQGASIALNPKTGGVQAVVGGRGEHVTRGLNRATQSSLSPGSTMKPLAVYTPALESGYKPDDMLKDEKLSFYDVENYDNVYRGEVPMYQAIADSLNPSAVWLFNKIGIEVGAKKVEKFGIKLDEKDHYPGLALGGMTKGTTPLRMASAYTVFANEGKKRDPHFIRKIVDATGAVVVDNEEAKVKSVTTPEVADKMTGMLQGVFSSGTGVNAKPDGYQIAGKTGTTESVNVDSQSKDQWIIGYTPDVVIATWIGFDESSEIHYLTGTSSQGISLIFKDQAQRILSHSPQTPFEVADVSQSLKEEEANNKEETEKMKAEFQENLAKLGDKVKEGTDYVGERLKEGAGDLGGQLKEGAREFRDQLGSLWNKVNQ